jgi:small GTP-binding protein
MTAFLPPFDGRDGLMSYSTENIRNVALAGHPGAGKTMLFEALLHAGGAIQTAGTIERGTTVSDFDPIEKERGHSVDAAIASIDTASDNAPVHINLLDTPGYPDFRGPTLSALAAVETVAVVVDADTGVEYGTRRMMEYAKARNLCRVVVVNKIDHNDADARRVLDELRETFGPELLPLNLPADGGTRVVDCFGYSGSVAEGDSDLGAVADWHQKIIDQVVEVNETVMDHYLDLGEDGLSGQELHDAFEQCLREGHLVPVCFVSARSGIGVRELLDVAGRLFPHPGEANPPPFVKGSGEGSDAGGRHAGSEGARGRRRLQDRQRPLRRQARHLPRVPGHGEEGLATVRRRRQEAVQGRPPVQGERQGPRGNRRGDPGRHRRRGEGGRPAFRRGAARLARRRRNPPHADGFPAADVRPGGGSRAQGPGAEAVRCAA